MKFSSFALFVVFAAFCASVAQPYMVDEARGGCQYAAKQFTPKGTVTLAPVYITGNVIEVEPVVITVYR